MHQSTTTHYPELSDVELIELLFTLGDGLGIEVINEIVDRGSRMIPYLYVIVSDKTTWTRPVPEWWAVVHATYTLGAFESADTLTALLASLRWADAFDSEWVVEDMPSIFGKLGKDAFGPLSAILRDVAAGWGARSIAISAMAATTITAPFLRDSFFDLAAKIVADHTEPVPLRQTAANVLLDFRCEEHRSVLVKFGTEEEQRREEIPDYEGAFYSWEVDEFLSSEESESDIDFYNRDWLIFYDPEERERRRDYWAEEKKRVGQSYPEHPDFQSEKYVALCPCGSGMDYSECCMKKIH